MLKRRGVEFDVIEYLKNPPTRAVIERLIAMLAGPGGSPAAELVRKDKRFSELKLNGADYVTAAAVAALLEQHPELMQRPIVIRAGRAVIARPPEKLEALF